MTSAPAERIAPQSWMRQPATHKVMAALEAAGGAGCARFVGGCVRNAIMERPVDDVDVATTLTPDEVILALTRARLKAVPTGVAHGTITAVADHTAYEITTLRRDVETDGRRAVVAFTTDWLEDAQRRDFRLNAIYCDEAGRLFDPTGEGVADARAGRIVFVGEAQTRVREDYLRILRFFRFHAWYGRGEPDAVGLQVCAERREGLRSLSVERIAKELLKLLAARDPRSTVRLMAKAGVLDEVLPQAQDLSRLDRLVDVERSPDGLLRLAALLPPDASTAAAVAGRLKLSNAQRNRLVSAAPPMPFDTGERALRAQIYRAGRQAALDRLALAWAAQPQADPAALWPRLDMIDAAEVAPPPFKGAQIVAAGAPSGPLVGQVQKALEAWWIAQDFAADAQQCDDALRSAVRDALDRATGLAGDQRSDGA